jgi:hypothetical protein
MARTPTVLRALAIVALSAALAACTAAPAASSPVAVTPVANGAVPAPSSVEASASPAAAIASPSDTLAPTDSPTPSRSRKPIPSLDPAELDAIMTSSITLVDLADADLAVSVAYVDPGSTKPFDLGTYKLGFTEQLTNKVPVGTYRLDFRQPATSKTGPRCTITIADGDAFTFAAIDGAVAITKAGVAPKAAGDLFVATSPLCGK